MNDLIHLLMPHITAVAIAIPRVLAALFLIPVFSFKLLKGMPRFAVAAAIALPVALPLAEEIRFSGIKGPLLGFIMLKEAMVGIVIGYLLAIPFWIFQSVGVLIDSQRGALSGGYFNPGAGADNSMLGDMLSRVLVILLISMGAFPGLFAVVIETYVLWPVLDWTPAFATNGYEVFIEHFGTLTYKFVLYAGPVILVLLLVEAGFAILGTYTPQLQVYFMAMPAKALVALSVLVSYFATLWYLGGADLIAFQDLKNQLPKIFLPL